MGSSVKNKHIRFDEANSRSDKVKTSIWTVCNCNTNYILGHVKWHSAWRKYCFLPCNNTIFDASCLEEIAFFCSDMTETHKLGWKNVK